MSGGDQLVPELFELSEAAHGLSMRLAARGDPTVPAGAAAQMLTHAAEAWPVLEAFAAYGDLAPTFARLTELAPVARDLTASAGRIGEALAVLHPMLRDRLPALVLPLSTAFRDEYPFPLLQPLGLARAFAEGEGLYRETFDEVAKGWREADAKSGGMHSAEVEAVIAAYAAPRDAALAAMEAFAAPAAETRAAIGRCRQAVDGAEALFTEAEALGAGLKAANFAMRPGGRAVKQAAGMVGPAAFTLGYQSSEVTDEMKNALLRALEGAIGMISASIDLGTKADALAREAAPLPGLADTARTLAGKLDAGREALERAVSDLEGLAGEFERRIAAWNAAQETLADPAFVARQEALATALGMDKD